MKKIIIITCFFTLLIGCKTDSSKAMNTVVFHKTHEPKKSGAPFSDIVQVGNMYFLSGQVGMDHTIRKLVEGGIEAETKQTLDNIKEVLEHHDMKMEDVVKCTVILNDIEDFSAFNRIYETYFPQKPARTTFAAKDLAVGAAIEIECIAVKQDKIR
ncbi:RidA family protein [Aquimarina sediminis]|uniref:RidA family protein n=1 Tax=Aquimarina sediminis TaxID=2070536 RepID=UPI000CA01061|nr:RidA family protein [Aquimarina sediminis]